MTTRTFNGADLRGLGLCAVTTDAISRLARVGGDDLHELERLGDPRDKRERLAMVVRCWVEDAEGSARAFVANVGAVALALLALRHELEGDDAPSLAAAASIPWLLEPDRRALLLPQVAELAEDLRDGIALGDGKAALVRHARALLERASRLDPLALHVSGKRLVLGGKLIAYRRSNLRGGRRVPERRYLGLGGAEGRLLLLAAAGRPPRIGVASVASHVRSAITEVTSGRVRLARDLTLEPPLRLTARAARVAARLRWVTTARARQDPDDEVRSRHAAPTDAPDGARGVRGRVHHA